MPSVKFHDEQFTVVDHPVIARGKGRCSCDRRCRARDQLNAVRPSNNGYNCLNGDGHVRPVAIVALALGIGVALTSAGDRFYEDNSIETKGLHDAVSGCRGCA